MDSIKNNKAQLYIIVDTEGVKAVEIIGTGEAHHDGHDLYFRIQDLILDLDKAIQRKIKENEVKKQTDTRSILRT